MDHLLASVWDCDLHKSACRYHRQVMRSDVEGAPKEGLAQRNPLLCTIRCYGFIFFFFHSFFFFPLKLLLSERCVRWVDSRDRPFPSVGYCNLSLARYFKKACVLLFLCLSWPSKVIRLLEYRHSYLTIGITCKHEEWMIFFPHFDADYDK